MNIGIVAQWFNRGQASVGRYLRDAFTTLGHRTFVLARPAKDRFYVPGAINHSDVWNQEGVETASHFQIPQEEYRDWATRHQLDLIWFDQNYQFPEIQALRRAGHRTIGRFVWESFGEQHVPGAVAALDCIYALTDCEHQRYHAMGIESRRVPWGIHPELLVDVERKPGPLRFFYPGGFLSTRKPTGEVYQAFRAFHLKFPDSELTIKTQRPLRLLDLDVPKSWRAIRKSRGDEEQNSTTVEHATLIRDGIRVVEEDLPAAEYQELFASCDVCVAPSRWEGLGLHLWEALGHGLPVVCNDMLPLNEVVVHGENGLLTSCRELDQRPSGIPVMAPEIDSLSHAFAQVMAPGVLARLREGVIRSRERFRWEDTLRALQSLIGVYA